MNSTNIADGVPKKLFISIDFNFFVDSSHMVIQLFD